MTKAMSINLLLKKQTRAVRVVSARAQGYLPGQALRVNWQETVHAAFDCAMRVFSHLAVQPLRRPRHAAASHGFSRGEVTPTVRFCSCAQSGKTMKQRQHLGMYVPCTIASSGVYYLHN